MPVELSIVETVTELETTIVEVILDSSSAPGVAGPGVPVGGTDGQVLTKTSATDYATAWEDPTGGAGGGAPDDADYLVGTAHGDLSAEIVVGATPGGELGGTWAAPTVDATHSGSSHAATQAAAEATAAAALAAHATDTSDAHDASAVSIADAGNDFTATDVEGALAELQADHETDAQNLSDHIADATAVHAAAAVSADSTSLSGTGTDVQAVLEELDNLLDDHSARHENNGADEISLAGLDGVPTALQTHLDDTADAHDASAISILDVAGDFTATDVEAALAELQSDHEADEAALAAHITDVGDAHDGSAISNVPAGGIAAVDVQAAINELDSAKAAAASAVMDGDAAGGVLSGTYPDPGFAADMATQAELDAHLTDASAAHAASAISADSTTLVGTGTDVQAVLEELDNGIADHLADTSDAHDASAISFSPTGTIAATDVQAAIAEVASEAGGGVPDLQYESRSTNTILGTADKGKTIDITATITQTFEADETLGDGWWVILRNATDEGTVVVTLDPAGAETIDGLSTVTMYSGEARLIVCNGAGGNFNSVLLQGGFARFTADGNFIVPHGITQATVEVFGGGGGGGGARGGAAGSSRNGGSGGGGGARIRVDMAAAALGNPGDTIAVDVAAGGTSGGGGSSANGSNGNTGGTTTFGSLVSAFGGGPGLGGAASANNRSGGGGGGWGEAGLIGANNTSSRGGSSPLPSSTAREPTSGGGGAGSGVYITANAAEYGGGSGGHTFGAGGGNGPMGGDSKWGGAGGGAGSDVTAGNVEREGGLGGTAGGGSTMKSIGGGGAVNGGAGAAGAAGDLRICGSGGAGGGSQDSGTGGAGGNGGAPGGGAGGGGAGTTVGGAGGTGGIGECRVWYS